MNYQAIWCRLSSISFPAPIYTLNGPRLNRAVIIFYRSSLINQSVSNPLWFWRNFRWVL